MKLVSLKERNLIAVKKYQEKKVKNKGFCIDCGCSIWVNHLRCIKCYHKGREGKSINLKANAKYEALHQYVRSKNIMPKLCEECKKEKKLDLANIRNHIYSRDIKDYKWLCRKCHKKMDLNGEKCD